MLDKNKKTLSPFYLKKIFSIENEWKIQIGCLTFIFHQKYFYFKAFLFSCGDMFDRTFVGLFYKMTQLKQDVRFSLYYLVYEFSGLFILSLQLLKRPNG